MPQIGDIAKGTEIGKLKQGKFIWHACVRCGKERWVAYENGKAHSIKCISCAARTRRGHYYNNRRYPRVQLNKDSFFFPMAQVNGLVAEHRLIMAQS
jgi:hypothetical protein